MTDKKNDGGAAMRALVKQIENFREHVEIRLVSDLMPYSRNAKVHPEWQIARLANIIKEFGFLVPCIIEDDGTLVAGHCRCQAAIKLDLPKVPCINAKHLTAAQIKAFRIADNKIPEMGSWDQDFLRLEFDELKGMNFDLALTGFDDAPAPAGNQGNTDPDKIPEKAPARCKLGDLWQLGDHRLLCGDSTKREEVERLMGGEKANMVFTDPPYGVNERTMRKSAGRGKLAENHDLRPVIGDDSTDTAIAAFNLCQELDLSGIWWGANYYAHSIPEVKSWLVWDKRVDVASDDNADCELAWVWNNKPARIFRHLWKGCIRQSEKNESKVHPTQKPIALAEWCFAQYGDPKIVLDLFLGSGSTLIACEKTNRRCFGMEIDPYYCDVVIKRWEDFSGKTARLDGEEMPTPKAAPASKKPKRMNKSKPHRASCA